MFHISMMFIQEDYLLKIEKTEDLIFHSTVTLEVSSKITIVTANVNVNAKATLVVFNY